MCLDPRPEFLSRAARSARRLTRRAPSFGAPLFAGGLPASAPVVRAPALWALDALAGDDELVARGWIVLSREA